MMEFLCHTLELMVILPGMLLAYLPMKQYLRLRPAGIIAAVLPLSLLVCAAGGAAAYLLPIRTIWLLPAAAAVMGSVYALTLRTTRWKSVSIFLAVCGVFACLDSLARALDLILAPENDAPCLSLPSALLYNLLCWMFTGIAYRPATHAARELLGDDSHARKWYVFWILPLLFIGLCLLMSPICLEILYQSRLIWGYIAAYFALLFLLLLVYLMFYIMAASLSKNDRLRQENQFLSMQQARYDNLRTAIAQTREARHDMRHHFNILLHFAGNQEWDALKQYLAEAADAMPDAELNLCDNAAADSVAGHYGLLFRMQDIPFSFAFDLPGELPVPEMDLCLVLSNLLENALEASLRTTPPGGISVRRPASTPDAWCC